MKLLKVTKLCCTTWYLRLLDGLIYKGQLSKIMSYVYHVHHCSYYPCYVAALFLSSLQRGKVLRYILYQCCVNAQSFFVSGLLWYPWACSATFSMTFSFKWRHNELSKVRTNYKSSLFSRRTGLSDPHTSVNPRKSQYRPP